MTHLHLLLGSIDRGIPFCEALARQARSPSGVERAIESPAWCRSRVHASGAKAMRGAWSALLSALVAAVAATGHQAPPQEPEARDALAHLKARILAGLGMQRPPDLRHLNVSQEHVQRMTRRYFRNLKHTQQELLTYHQTGKLLGILKYCREFHIF